MVRAYIGLGSNQGDPAANIREALQMINKIDGLKVTGVSSLYLTEPVGYENQPWFHNCAAEVETELSPDQLLAALQGIEDFLGRVRVVRWGPRTIDLDILLYDTITVETENLTIPHPRMAERAFVIVPLAEIAGNMVSADGRTILEVRDQLTAGKKYVCIPQKIW